MKLCHYEEKFILSNQNLDMTNQRCSLFENEVVVSWEKSHVFERQCRYDIVQEMVAILHDKEVILSQEKKLPSNDNVDITRKTVSFAQYWSRNITRNSWKSCKNEVGWFSVILLMFSFFLQQGDVADEACKKHTAADHFVAPTDRKKGHRHRRHHRHLRHRLRHRLRHHRARRWATPGLKTKKLPGCTWTFCL